MIPMKCDTGGIFKKYFLIFDNMLRSMFGSISNNFERLIHYSKYF